MCTLHKYVSLQLTYLGIDKTNENYIYIGESII